MWAFSCATWTRSRSDGVGNEIGRDCKLPKHVCGEQVFEVNRKYPNHIKDFPSFTRMMTIVAVWIMPVSVLLHVAVRLCVSLHFNLYLSKACHCSQLEFVRMILCASIRVRVHMQTY